MSKTFPKKSARSYKHPRPSSINFHNALRFNTPLGRNPKTHCRPIFKTPPSKENHWDEPDWVLEERNKNLMIDVISS